MKPIANTILQILPATAYIALAGCGGGEGGTGVASAPPPPTATAPTSTTAATPTATGQRTPLPATPATTSGTWQGISTVMSLKFAGTAPTSQPQMSETVLPVQLAPPGSVTLSIDRNTLTYTLTVSAGAYSFPSGQMTMPAESELGYSRNTPLFGTPAEMVARGDMLARTVPAGTTSDGALRVVTSWLRLYNAGQLNGGPRYLSAAQWGQFYQVNPTGTPGPENFKVTEESMGTMVFGQRTEAGDIPATGSARYALSSLTRVASDAAGTTRFADLSTQLDVDFATRGLSATYNLAQTFNAYATDEDGNPLLDKDGNTDLIEHLDTTIRATGSTKVANDGSFAVALAGRGTVQTIRPHEAPVPDISSPVSGSLTGAFFGPKAAEVGGIAMLPVIASDGSVSASTDAFFGQRSAP